MNDYFTTTGLFDEDILLQSDKEDGTSVKSLTEQLEKSVDQLSDYSSSEAENQGIGDIVEKSQQLSLGYLQQANAKLDSETTPYVTVNPEIETVSSSNGAYSENKKRVREQSANNSFDSKSTGPPTKRRKKVIMSDSEEETTGRPECHLVLLLPDTKEPSLFSKKQEEKIHSSVGKAVRAEENKDVKFDYSGPDRGRYKFVCPNDTAKQWALTVVPKLTGLSDKIKIKAVDQGILPKMIRASVTFSDNAPDSLDLFEGLEDRNDTLDTLHWRPYNRKKVQNKKTVIFFGIDEASVKPLKDLGNRPYYDGGRIRVTVFESNNK